MAKSINESASSHTSLSTPTPAATKTTPQMAAIHARISGIPCILVKDPLKGSIKCFPNFGSASESNRTAGKCTLGTSPCTHDCP